MARMQSNGYTNNGTNGIHEASHAVGIENGLENSDPPQPHIPIAIVGMACRFGGDVTSPSKLWDLCAAGSDSWSPIPEERFNVKSLYHPDKNRIGRVRPTQPVEVLTSDK